jgi:hypothetical protein
MYTLSIMASSNSRKLFRNVLSQPSFPLSNPVEQDNMQETSWYKDPETGRVTDASTDAHEANEDTAFSQAEEALPVTNQPIERFQEVAPHYPILFSCAHVFGSESTTTSTLNDVTVPIIVEALMPTSILDIAENIQALQWSFLNAVGDRSGLTGTCNLDLQYDDDGMLRRKRLVRRLQVSILQYPTAVYAISSNPSTEWRGKQVEAREKKRLDNSLQCFFIERLPVKLTWCI